MDSLGQGHLIVREYMGNLCQGHPLVREDMGSLGWGQLIASVGVYG